MSYEPLNLHENPSLKLGLQRLIAPRRYRNESSDPEVTLHELRPAFHRLRLSNTIHYPGPTT